MASGAGVKALLCVDDSEHAHKAMEFYLGSVHKPNHEVILVHSMEIPYQPVQPLREEIVNNIFKTAQKEGKQVVDKFAKELKQRNIKFSVKSEFDRPGEYVCKVAKEEGASMIVIGTRGMGAIRRTILGSVSDYVVHHAHCPVIVCRH